MNELGSASPRECDALIVGAGLAGAAAAIGFARAGFSVVCCGPPERMGHGRTVALMGRSLGMLEELGVWSAVEAKASPLRTLRLIDDTGALFAARPVEFRAAEINLEAFGWNIENRALADGLQAALIAEPSVVRVESPVVSFAFSEAASRIETADGRRFAPRLVIGADGRGSPSRKAAGIDLRSCRYDQSALTVALRHTRDHQGASTEFHTREGPFTLVPMRADEGGFRSSLVWLMREEKARRRSALGDVELGAEIEKRARGIIGAITIGGDRGLFPMTRQNAARLTGARLALVGDAAHAFPPIGAQGLNLGLRDVDGLLKSAISARREGADIGGAAVLASYAASRATDIALRSLVVNGLNMSLLADFAPVDALRASGLAALAAFGPLRRFAMREGMSPAIAS